MRMGNMNRKRGFTLVETVVTVGIVAALAAVVYPAVVKQFDSADPARAAQDLTNIATGIETFGVNVRPNQPQEIEDLVNVIQAATANDSSALGGAYTAADVANWNGPYLGLSVPSTTARDAAVLTTGFGGLINNRLPLFDLDAAAGVGDTVPTSAATSAEFVSILITGLSGASYNALNLLVDGPGENTLTLRRQAGRLRCIGGVYTLDTDACAAAYFLASPLRQ